MRLKGKTALVTGAADGFGRVMGLALLHEGARVAFADRKPFDRVAGEIARFGEDALTVSADLSRQDEVARLADTVEARLGPVNVLINNAGIGPGVVRSDYLKRPVRFWEHDEAHMRLFLDVHVIAPYRLAVRVLDGMLGANWGRIVNVTTSLDTMLLAGMAGYGGSKAALEAHTAIMAGDLADTGITANVLVPGGPANTPMIPPGAVADPSLLIQPEVMAAPALWLASDESNGISGRRFNAVRWDAAATDDDNVRQASMPIAWSAPGSQALLPKDFAR